MAPIPAQESAVDDFIPRAGLCSAGAGWPERAWTSYFSSVVKPRYTRTDVCIVTDDDILLLVQEDKRHKEPSDPDPQLIC